MPLRSLSAGVPVLVMQRQIAILCRPARLRPIGTADATGGSIMNSALSVCLFFASVHMENVLQNFPTAMED